MNVAFNQEHSFGRYSIDFYLTELHIGLEVDGEYWHQDKAKDTRRDMYMNTHGIRVIRITDRQINNAISLDVTLLELIK